MVSQTCAHCGLALRGSPTIAEVRGEERAFCCSGCAFVYELTGSSDSGGESAESWFLVLLGFSAVLSGFIMAFSWALYLNPDLPLQVRDLLHYILLGLATPVIFGVGYSYLKTAVRELTHARLSMASLIALGTITAYAYSAYLTFRHGEHVYFDTATMVIVLVTVGRFLQARARARAAQAMRTFVTQMPQQARRLAGHVEETVAVEEIRTGDLLRVLPAEKIAVDGRIREGRTTVDESLLTGESVPVMRGPGDLVLQGTINLDGAIVFEATQVGQGTMQAQIERLLAEAIGARLPLQALVDRVSAAFVVVTLTLCAGVGLYYTLHHQPVNGFLNALAVLVVACPCALGLATPLASFVALQRAAREGVLIRIPEALEKMAQIDCVVFDKTGTLTEGKLRVQQVLPAMGLSPERLLRVAASLESCSEHHAARAILEEFGRRPQALLPVDNFVNHPGEGVEGSLLVGGSPDSPSKACVHLGTLISLRRRGLELPADLARREANAGLETRVYVGWEGWIRGVIRLQDRLRAGAEETIRRCRRQGLDIRLLSGDHRECTRHVAEQLGMSDWTAEQLPWQKVAYIEQLQAAGRRVAMVGDGVNDAPALGKATVAFAHQVGTDLSKEAADVHILGGELSRVPWSLSLAKRTFRHIRQNLFWAFFYNVIAMGMAAAGWLKPVIAAAAMLLSSMMVVGNSMRLGKAVGLTAPAPASKPAGSESEAVAAEASSEYVLNAYAARETPRAGPANSA